MQLGARGEYAQWVNRAFAPGELGQRAPVSWPSVQAGITMKGMMPQPPQDAGPIPSTHRLIHFLPPLSTRLAGEPALGWVFTPAHPTVTHYWETLLFGLAGLHLAWCAHGRHWYFADDPRRTECVDHRRAGQQARLREKQKTKARERAAAETRAKLAGKTKSNPPPLAKTP